MIGHSSHNQNDDPSRWNQRSVLDRHALLLQRGSFMSRAGNRSRIVDAVLRKKAAGSLFNHRRLGPILGDQRTVGILVHDQPPGAERALKLGKGSFEVQQRIMRRSDASAQVKHVISAFLGPLAGVMNQ